MSKSEIAQLVPVLDGSNYGIWSKSMKAYLMSLGYWGHANGSDVCPRRPQNPELDRMGNAVTATKDEIEQYRLELTVYNTTFPTWVKEDEKALGAILLRVNDAIKEEMNFEFTEEAWDALATRYGQSTPTVIYKDFKEAISIRFKAEENPNKLLDKMSAAFQRLSGANVTIPGPIQAMIALSALPQRWEVLVPVITQTNELSKLCLQDVREAIVAQWQTDASRHSGNKDKKPQNAHKLSNVKRKRGDPSFSSQQQGNNQQQQQNGDKPRQRGKRGGKGKGKGKASDGHSHAHISHIADVASIAPPTTSTVAQMGPSGIQKRTIFSPAPKERTPGPYKALNEALDTADTEGVTPTIQTVKTLEQRITEQYMDGPWSKSTNYLSDDEGSDIVDMSEVPAGHDGQDDWDAFAAASPSYEPLDWGSDFEDAEACVPSSTSSLHSIHQALVSPPPQRRPGLKDGSCNIAPRTYTLSSLICEHEIEFALCAKCKEKRATSATFGPQWLLDSGASSHFTFDINDFIEYTPLKGNERTAVKTAAHTVYAEGTGAVLITHWENDEEVTTRLHPVLHISTLHVRLLSMGEFLQHDWVVRGNSQAIALCNSLTDTPYITCEPIFKGDNIFWLHAVITNVQEGQCVYTVDYDTMHKRLGHPSKDVMSQVKKHCNGAPSDFEIPKQTPVCPGCAQGKMPASSHPPSDTRAKAPFERIHSDLKSFPVVSYHKYKYFVSFLDDYTSYAWIVLLRDKASAIIALKQFMAMAKTQYGADIKEWMSDAGGEYKSDAFLKTLKDAGIKILQSVPHTPQQNGRAERFMRTVMDKAESMRIDACIPQSWWEFSVLHALHCYNRTPLRRHKWQTPYGVLNDRIPDISHLYVFECGAYVHIPKGRRANALSPKSELMVYLGRPEGIKGDTFMRLQNNTLFTSDTALFDEAIFPMCDKKSRIRGVTRLKEPRAQHSPLPADKDTTPGDFDEPETLPPTPIKKDAAPESDGTSSDSEVTPESGPPAPPPAPEPVPLRRSQRLRKIPTRPGNVYGERRTPVEIEKDIQRNRTWDKMTENIPGSFGDDSTSGQQPASSQADPPAPTSEIPLPEASDDEVDELLRLQREGGVKYLDLLLAKAVPATDPGSPDTAKIREWTFRDILKMPSASQKEWKQACREELESLRRRKVFELVDPPAGRKVIRNRWVFDLKSDGRKKARLVAKGFSQVEGIDYDEIFSPVVRFETVRMMIALAALKNWHITGLDVKTAFLYGELEEELYMEQPEGFKLNGQERKVMRLKRAIYGLKQAALAWWKALDKSMAALGLTRLLSDSGLFVNKERTIVAIVYVDDVLFLGADKPKLLRLKEQFMKVWECRDLGDAQEFLRMRIQRKGGKIYLDQTVYLQKVLQRFNVQNMKAVPTPLPEGYNPSPNTSTADPSLRSKFQQVIGSLLYIMLGTRPDIAFAVTKLSQHAANPSEEHLSKALYICRYLLGTPDYAMVYDGPSNGGLMAYADSDWASDPNTRKSTTGYMVKLAGAIFSWNSRAQKTVALSSTEAEYMSLSDTCKQLVWVKSLMTELGINLAPVPLFGDNQGSIFLGSNPVQEKRIKHIDLRYHFIRDVITSKQVELFFIEGANNPADMFTKNLGRVKFLKFREQLGLEFYSS
jgi:hypothetical protein